MIKVIHTRIGASRDSIVTWIDGHNRWAFKACPIEWFRKHRPQPPFSSGNLSKIPASQGSTQKRITNNKVRRVMQARAISPGLLKWVLSSTQLPHEKSPVRGPSAKIWLIPRPSTSDAITSEADFSMLVSKDAAKHTDWGWEARKVGVHV